jgi:hypothetical protein
MKKAGILFGIVFCLVLVGCANAAPNITSVTGNITNGNTITISGSGFGIKTQASPLLWENFESGTNEQNLSSTPTNTPWKLDYGGGTPGTYSNLMHYGGGLSGRMYIVGNAVTHTYASLGNQTKVFASYRFYHPSGYNGLNLKMMRIGNSIDVHDYTYMGYTGSNSQYYYLYRSINDSTNLPPGEYNECPANTWTRDDYYIELSSMDIANGKIGIWRNGSQIYWNDSIITRDSGGGAYITTLFLPYYADGSDQLVYVDNIYVDNTLARIEICKTSDWSTRTNCEIQIPTKWSNNSINITLNQGSFANASTVYLYVVDSNGNISNPYNITIGSTSSDSGICEATGTGKCYYVATNGSDSNNGSFSYPFKTINHAISSSNGGDVIYIHSGTYNEYMLRPKSGIDINHPTILKAYNFSNKPVIQGSYSDPNDRTFDLIGNYITLDGLDIQGGGGSNCGAAICLGYDFAASYITIKNCYISGPTADHDQPAHIRIGYGGEVTNVIIENNEITGAIATGIKMHVQVGSCGHYLIQNNYIHDTLQGITVKWGNSTDKDIIVKNNLLRNISTRCFYWDQSYATIENNVCDTASNGMYFGDNFAGTYNTIKHNTFYGCSGDAYYFAKGANNTFLYNIRYQSSTVHDYGPGGNTFLDYTNNPLFANASNHDFSLLIGSGAKGTAPDPDNKDYGANVSLVGINAGSGYVPPTQYCGDTSCNNGETCSNCPQDCKTGCSAPNVTTMQKLLNSFGSFKSESLTLNEYINKIKEFILG